MTDKQELKSKLMTELTAKLFEGKVEEFVNPMSPTRIASFLNNVEKLVDEILKRSSK